MSTLKTYILFLLFFTLKTFYAYSQDTCFVSSFLVGESTISIEEKCFDPCNSGTLFLNLHDNENTSVEAAQEYLMPNGGKLISIYNNDKRFVGFKMNSKQYYFDPNRIYSDSGRHATIKLLSGSFNDNAADEVAYFANQILINYIDSSKLVVALHNNTDSNLSALTYWEVQSSNMNWGNTFINPLMDPDDFILTTDTVFYSRIKQKNINVVWENVDSISDDGSLSIYAAKNKIPYINIEAQHDHLDEQCVMLAAIKEILQEFVKAKEEEGKK